MVGNISIPVQPAPLQEREKLLKQGKNECGLTQAQKDVEECQKKSDSIDQFLLLPRKQRIMDFSDYDLKKALDIEIAEGTRTNRMFMPIANGYIFGMGGFLMMLDKMGFIPYSLGMPLLFGFIGSCFLMPVVLRKVLDHVVTPRRVDKAMVAQLNSDRKTAAQRLEESKRKESEAAERFRKWQNEHDIFKWLTPDGDSKIVADEEFINIDGTKLKVKGNQRQMALLQ